VVPVATVVRVLVAAALVARVLLSVVRVAGVPADAVVLVFRVCLVPHDCPHVR
jgi:hypothetical protein